MSNYFRITGYFPQQDICFIADSNGKFEKLWQFSSCLVQKGVKIIAVGNSDKFDEGNIPLAKPDPENIIMRACDKGKPNTEHGIIEIRGRQYIPDKEAMK